MTDIRRTEEPLEVSAYGGEGWSPRMRTHREEIGSIWSDCGIAAEWTPLKAVLLHEPGAELQASADWNAVQMLEPLDLPLAVAQHRALAQAYNSAGVRVHLIQPSTTPPPNQMFVADLLWMTPEGAVLARPASTVRAGEERNVARRLAELGMPVLRTLRGGATFEGADAMWLSPQTVIIGRGPRTNAEGAAQIAGLLKEMNVNVLIADMPYGTMHLMAMLRFLDRDLAIVWPRRIATSAVEALRAHGYKVVFVPDEAEAATRSALNFVTLGPRKVLMPDGCPAMQSLLSTHGVECRTVDVSELRKAAGAIGCLTGVLHRDLP